jgi:hypothetical protein
MQKQGFICLVLGAFLTGPFAFAQANVDEMPLRDLTPFQARVIMETDLEGGRTSRLLRIQLSEGLAAQPLLDCKIVNRIGIPVFRFQISTRSEERKVRFFVPLPEEWDPDSYYFLSIQGSDASRGLSLNYPITPYIAEEGVFP